MFGLVLLKKFFIFFIIMKIAICFKGKFNSGSKEARIVNSNYSRLSHQIYKENLFKPNSKSEIDVFVHCWDKEHKDEIDSLYAPKGSSYKGTEEVQTKINNRPITNRIFTILSNWYSIMESVNQMREYEIKNNFRYDLVLIARFDVALLIPLDFSKYNLDLKNKLYHSGPDPIHGAGCKCVKCIPSSPKYEIPDLMFFSNSDNISAFSKVFQENDLNFFVNLNSNHFIGAIKVNQLNLQRDCLTKTTLFDKWIDLQKGGNITICRWMDGSAERNHIFKKITGLYPEQIITLYNK